MAKQPNTPATIEREQELALVRSAIAKQQRGQRLRKQELAAWKRFESAEDERRGRRFLSALPKTIYCQISGRQTKILHDQADLYGLPLRGATIDVAAVLTWLHDFLAKHKHDLAPLVKGDVGGDRPAGLRDQLLAEQVDLYRRKNTLLEEQITLVQSRSYPHEEIHAVHERMATILRAAGEQLGRQFGDDAADVLNVALENVRDALATLDVSKNAASLRN
jgi:hypothetical protein